MEDQEIFEDISAEEREEREAFKRGFMRGKKARPRKPAEQPLMRAEAAKLHSVGTPPRSGRA
jgi:hypothetical protein